jgi:hypothetical protein
MTWVVEGAARELAPLLRPGAPDADLWFPILETKSEAAQTHTIVADALGTLHRQRASIRDSLDLIASQQVNLQLEVSREEAAQGARLQHAVGVVGGIFLGPALMAALWGALPKIAENTPAVRVPLVVVTTILAGVLAYTTFQRFVVRAKPAPNVAGSQPRGGEALGSKEEGSMSDLRTLVRAMTLMIAELVQDRLGRQRHTDRHR